MSIIDSIEKSLNQTMVYWGAPVNDGYGNFTYAAPVEITARCEYANELVMNDKGEEAVSQARVFLLTTLDIGGYLYLGSLTDSALPANPTPKDVDDSMRIIAWEKVPRLRSTEMLYKYFLNMEYENE